MIQSSQRFIRLIIRRPHAYWFKRRYPEAPIPGVVYMSPEGKVLGTFPFLRPGQTLEKFRASLEKHASKKPEKKRQKVRELY